MFLCQKPMLLCSSVKYPKRATLADCSPVLLSHKDSNLKLQNQNLTCCQLHHGTNFKCFLSKDGAKLQSYFDMSKIEGLFFDGGDGEGGRNLKAGSVVRYFSTLRDASSFIIYMHTIYTQKGQPLRTALMFYRRGFNYLITFLPLMM